MLEKLAVAAERRVGAVKDGRLGRIMDVEAPLPVRERPVVVADVAELLLVGPGEVPVPRQEVALPSLGAAWPQHDRQDKWETYSVVDVARLEDVHSEEVVKETPDGRELGRVVQGWCALHAIDRRDVALPLRC